MIDDDGDEGRGRESSRRRRRKEEEFVPFLVVVGAGHTSVGRHVAERDCWAE